MDTWSLAVQVDTSGYVEFCPVSTCNVLNDVSEEEEASLLERFLTVKGHLDSRQVAKTVQLCHSISDCPLSWSTCLGVTRGTLLTVSAVPQEKLLNFSRN